ncbi:MAG: aminopeptidase [Candidatus Riflebacteria bacterium]|nr:aminopeptidase [Candidatus Riflebacteria bacterium]
MSFESKIEKFAELTVKTGLNIQKGQLVIINASVEHVPQIRTFVEAAYNAGAGEVIVNWADPICGLMTMLNADEEALKRHPQWEFDKARDYQKRGCAVINILSSDPRLMENVDSGRIGRIEKAHADAMKGNEDIKNYTAKNEGQWCIISFPNPRWAKMVFPYCSEVEAINRMWDDIFYMCRITNDNDPIAEWKKHTDKIIEHKKKLTEYQFKELRCKNSLGTDITVGLVDNHVWAGGAMVTTKGVSFIPNLPTEEVFCMPHNKKTNGKVFASKPLCISGKLVKDFWFEFKDGVVVDFGASENYESLKNFLNTDEGAKHLGEIALISHDSPISNLGRIFYNGLIDENASCHMAVGTSFPYNIKNGTDLSEDELKARGSNISMVHLDFMFGTRDMSIIGIDQNNKEVQVFKDGNFVF